MYTNLYRPQKKVIYYAKQPLKIPLVKPVKRQQRVQRNFCKTALYSIWKYLGIYFEKCSMHGLSYFVKKKLTNMEKIAWLILIVICHIFCIIIGYQSFQRFRYKSTVIGVERNYHYWNTSVPGLTVCTMDRLDKQLFQQYCSAKNITDTKIQTELFDFLEHLANSTYFNFEDIPLYDSIDTTLRDLGIRPKNYMELIYNLTYNHIFKPPDGTDSSVIIFATDGRSKIETRQVLTEYGICYMTNTELDLKYSTDYAIFGRYPAAHEDIEQKSLQGTFFDADVSINFFGFLTNGLDSYLHSANEVPRVDNNVGMLVEAIQYTAFCMEITSDENFESAVAIEQRKCRFHHESNLTHFPLYTKNLCLQECRLNLAMELCGCIPHFYPNRIPKPKPVCDYKTLRTCFPPLKSHFLQLYRSSSGKIEYVNCQCLQNCDDTIVTLNNILPLTATKSLFGDSLGVRMTVDAWPRKRLKRQVVYSSGDLLVSFGSTAGLFLGFSVLSAIEFIYFFTLRLFYHLLGYKIA